MEPVWRVGAEPDDWEGVQRVTRARSGELSAFEALMRENNQRLYRACRSILRDPDEAEDAVQTAYLTAYTRLDQLKEASRFGAWVMRIAVNEALGRLRKRRDHQSLDTMPEVQFAREVIPAMEIDMNSEWSTGPEDAMTRTEIRQLLESCIDELPHGFRVAFVLREVEGLSVQQTAEALDVPADTVKTRNHRARKMLRDRLEKRLQGALPDVFSFAGDRCDRIVEGVISRLAAV
ncbi:MAG: RNA polymerase sigma factor [Dehalococcoidia bacterium]